MIHHNYMLHTSKRNYLNPTILLFFKQKLWLRDGTEFCTMYKVNGDFERFPFFT